MEVIEVSDDEPDPTTVPDETVVVSDESEEESLATPLDERDRKRSSEFESMADLKKRKDEELAAALQAIDQEALQARKNAEERKKRLDKLENLVNQEGWDKPMSRQEYKKRALETHPDKAGGSHDAFLALKADKDYRKKVLDVFTNKSEDDLF